MVYVTRSVNIEENEEMVHDMLDGFEVSLIPVLPDYKEHDRQRDTPYGTTGRTARGS